jgi:hypothetical protein
MTVESELFCFRCGSSLDALSDAEIHHVGGMLIVAGTGEHGVFPNGTYSCDFCFPGSAPRPAVPMCRLLVRLSRVLTDWEQEKRRKEDPR